MAVKKQDFSSICKDIKQKADDYVDAKKNQSKNAVRQLRYDTCIEISELLGNVPETNNIMQFDVDPDTKTYENIMLGNSQKALSENLADIFVETSINNEKIEQVNEKQNVKTEEIEFSNVLIIVNNVFLLETALK